MTTTEAIHAAFTKRGWTYDVGDELFKDRKGEWVDTVTVLAALPRGASTDDLDLYEDWLRRQPQSKGATIANFFTKAYDERSKQVRSAAAGSSSPLSALIWRGNFNGVYLCETSFSRSPCFCCWSRRRFVGNKCRRLGSDQHSRRTLNAQCSMRAGGPPRIHWTRRCLHKESCRT
jgi:hypothetical protein